MIKIPNPLSTKDTKQSIQSVLLDLATQEGSDGDPYDQMVVAVAYITYLEARLAYLHKECDLSIVYKAKSVLDKYVHILNKHGILNENYWLNDE